MENREELILSIKQSRKTYLFEYLAGFIILGMLLIFYKYNIKINDSIFYFLIIVSIAAILYPEFDRNFIIPRYKITDKKISIITGVIKQSVKNIHFLPLGFIPEINLSQDRLPHLLNYGTISINSGNDYFKIKNIDNPKNVMGLIEELIESNRMSMSSNSKIEK
ncbi:MAG: PH domain-containing protein [Nanoarchaeota archaeon]